MRQRSLSPRFFSDEDLVELAPATRLIFAGLWCLADREGRLEDRPRHIRLELHLALVDVEAALADLAECGKIRRYEVAGVRYLVVRGFPKYQRPHPREVASTLPEPPAESESRVMPRPAVKSNGRPRKPTASPSGTGPSGTGTGPSEVPPATTVSGGGAVTMVGVYVEACHAAGSDPTPSERGRVGREAKRLLELGKPREGIDWALGEAARRNTPHLILHLVGDWERDRAGTNRGAARPAPENPLDKRLRERSERFGLRAPTIVEMTG